MAEVLTKAGRYHIVGELGRGSMGVVYQGFDPLISRTVAIKTMLPEGLSPDEFEEYKTRFQREAMSAGILAHPNIITIFDFGEDSGVLYLAMEFLEGKSLEKIVQEQGVLPIEAILPIYDQVCSALDHAHRNMVVHRDVKPANIMILNSGLVKMTDFGIAKVMAMGMTQVGQILGTPNYMSPEQVRGLGIDGRSDIFSLGVILYELVTGEKPFGGRSIATIIYKIVNEHPIPPRELNASIPAGLSYVISKALAKNPDERYQTCRELAEDLRNYKNLGHAGGGQPVAVLNATPAAPMEIGEVSQLLTPAPQLSPPPPPPPPAAPTQYAPTAFDETPIGSLLETAEIHPPAPPKQSIPQVAWVLGAVLFVVVAMGLGYIVVRQRHRTPPAVTQAVETAPPVQNPQTPATPSPVVPAPAVTNPESAPAVVPETANHDQPARPAGAKLGQLMVSANVNGAKISVDGKSDPSWVTPHTITDLPAGVHNVEISMDGYESSQQSVTVSGGQTTNVAGNLSAPSAEFDVNTKPPGVEIFIDGKSYGPSPIRSTLPPGPHTYSVIQPGGTPYQNTVNLKSGEIITKTLTLGVVVSNGIVEVRSTPPGATVVADGSPVSGQTPTSFRLPVGSHALVISMPGFRPVQQQVTVSENATSTVNVTLASQ